MKADKREWSVGAAGSNYGGLSNSFYITDQNAGGGGKSRFMINTDGNVGIGAIDNPKTLLHLKRENEIDIWIEGKSPDIKFIHSKADYYTWRMGLDDDNGNLRFTLNEKNTSDPDKMVKDNLLVITPDGDVIAKGGSWMASDRPIRRISITISNMG